MRKKILQFTVIASILVFGACNNEETLPEIKPERTILLTASMPDDKPTPRTTLEIEGGNVATKWVINDKIELAFVQDEITIKSEATVTTTTNNGKTAQFEIIIPEEITEGSFDLYGVYGGGGLIETNPTVATIPTRVLSNASLDSIGKDVMLHFASKNIETLDAPVSVAFNHLGSLFSITIKTENNWNNLIGTPNLLKEVQLVGASGSDTWAYGFGDPSNGASYNLVTNEFINTDSGGNTLSFDITKGDISVDGTEITVWAWCPMPSIAWPDLRLEVTSTNPLAPGGVALASANNKLGKVNGPSIGKIYRFYAQTIGNQIYFTNAQYENDTYVTPPTP